MSIVGPGMPFFCGAPVPHDAAQADNPRHAANIVPQFRPAIKEVGASGGVPFRNLQIKDRHLQTQACYIGDHLNRRWTFA